MSTARTGSDRWLVRHRPCSDPTASLVCFPAAGAGASAYISWRRHLPADLELLAVELPGRDGRLGEAPLESCAEAADRIAPRIAAHPTPALVLFGHSLGAMLAFEVARRLRDHEGSRPVTLIVSGSRAPHLPSRLAWADSISDTELVRRLQELGCDPTGALSDPEVARLFLPALRADLVMAATYRQDGPDDPLDVPVLALSGQSDQMCDPAEVAAWRRHTAADFTHRRFAGGHFFVREWEAEVTAVVLDEIRSRTASASNLSGSHLSEA